MEELGCQQYQSFVLNVFEERTASFHDNINKNNISIFKSKVIQKAHQTKQEVSLFGRLHAAVHSREGDLENFFSHEIGLFPPALSELGKLRSGKKSDVLGCLIIQLNQLISTARLLTAPPLYTHYQQRLFEPLMTPPTRLSSLTFRNCPL